MDKPSRGHYTPTQFIDWRETGILEITPKFQRRGVWTLPQRSYFIDTILRQMPVPPIYLRNIYDIEKRKVIHEVIDGQQRIGTVLDYINGKYALYKNLDATYAGKRFDNLTDKQQIAIMTFAFNCEEFHDVSDAEVFEVFRRMNTYSTPLNKQELRHGRYFGLFSQSCNNLAKEYLEFWRKYRILSEKKITRMGEVQLTSSMLIAMVAGMQDKNDSIDRFYADNEESFPQKTSHEKRFQVTMDQIIDTFEDALADTQFRKTPFFYTLFCVVYHRLYGMPQETLRTPKKKRMSPKERESLRVATDRLSAIIQLAREEQRLTQDSGRDLEEPNSRATYPVKFKDFVAACLSQTDNINPRRVRFETLYREAFS